MSLNSIYLTVGGLIIAVFLTALAGPLFVDWNAYRPDFERQAERLIGQKVKVLGEAEAFLLPTPYVTFTDVRVGDAENPLMIVSRFSAHVELPPLLKGEIRVLDMTLERPDIRLSLDEDGRLITLGRKPEDTRAIALAPEAVAFDKIDIVDGALRLSNARSGRFHDIDGITMAVTARSLAGPFRAEGTARIAGEEQAITIATGALDETGAIRVKTEVKPADQPFSLLADGPFRLTDGRPDYSGSFILNRPAPKGEDGEAHGGKTGRLDRVEIPWRAEGSFALGNERLAVDTLEITYGTEDRRLNLTGKGAVSFQAKPSFDISLAAKQVDLDRMLAVAGPAPADKTPAGKSPTDGDPAASQRLNQLLAAIAHAPLPAIGGTVHLDLGGVVVAGGAVQSLVADIAPAARGWHLGSLTAQLPGRTDLSLSGDLTLHDVGGPRFEGETSLDIGQPAGLVSWWRGKGNLVGSGLEPFRISGRLTVASDGIALTEASLRTERSLARGDYAWQPGRDDKPASFSLDVTADHLESEQLAAAARLLVSSLERRKDGAVSGPGTNIFLRVKSDTLLVGDVEAAGVEALVSYADETLTVDRLTLADLAGARVVADGTVKNVTTIPDGTLDVAVTAKSMDGIASLVIDAFPGSDLARRLMNASSLLAPAVLSAQFSGHANGETTNATLHISGEAGGSELRLDTTFAGRLDRWREADIAVDGALSGPGGPHLLGQLGFDVLPIDAGGKARIAVTAKGRPNDSLAISGKAEMADSQFTAKGTTTLSETGNRYALDIALKSPDLGPLALMTGRVLPVLAGQVPVDLTGRFEGEGTRLALTAFSGSVAGTTVSGNGTGDFQGANATFRGALSLNAIDLAFLSELALGADVWSSQSSGTSDAAGRWPSVPFGPPLLGAIDADIDVTAKTVSLSPKLALNDARFRLSLTPDGMALDQIAGRIFDGKATGTVQLKRSTGTAGLSAAIRIADGNVTTLTGQEEGKAPLTGRFDLAVDVDSTGRSIAALVSGLAGSGSFTIRDGTVAGFGADAFVAAVQAVDDGSATRVDGINETAVHDVFAKAFSAGRARLDKVESVLSLASGAVWARNIRLTTPGLTALGTTSLDMSSLKLEGDWTVEPRTWRDTINASAPRAAIRYEGPVASPSLTFDVTPLISYLNLRAYELEQRRVDRLKDEILERDRLSRELRRLRESRERREKATEAEQRRREEKAKADEARRKAAEQRQRAEELRRQADEAARKAVRDAERATRGIVAPSPSPDLTDQIGAAINRARQRERAPAGPNQLLPLPQAIEVGPAPGGVLPGFDDAVPGVESDPLQLVPPPTSRTRQAPKSRIIQGPGGRVIVMPK